MGLDSIYHFLKPEYGSSRARIHRLMVKFNIHSIRTKIYKGYKNSGGTDFAPNLLNRNFVTDAPNKIWVGDITYIPTLEGWLYLAVVKDLFSKKIVGYAFSSRPDSNLVCNALILALNRQKPNANLIFHSDRGCQYNSYAFKTLLSKYNIIQSMSRSGNPYDNAVAENFFSCLKCECVHHSHFVSRKEACTTLFSYIEGYYNCIRPHSSINWLCPNSFEKSFKY